MENKQKNMEELLKEELKKEAEEIIAEVKADESLQNMKFPEDMDDKLFEMIRKHEAQKAAYEMLSDKDKEALRIGREIQFLGEDVNSVGNSAEGKVVRFKKKKKKMYLIVAAVAIMTLAAGMTSIGGAPFISKIKKQIIGEREMVKVNTDRSDGDSIEGFVNSEFDAYQDINESFGVETVRFGYKPSGMEFSEYELDEVVKKATVLYKYNDKIIEYKLFTGFQANSHGYDIEDTLEKQNSVNVGGIEITIKKYGVLGKQAEYVAQFKYAGIEYMLNAAISEEDFMEIIKNLKI